jgi:hypothetical protein
MSERRITSEDIKGLGNNIQAVFRFFHPNGLMESELEKRAAEQSFYRVVYQHYQQEQGAK